MATTTGELPASAHPSTGGPSRTAAPGGESRDLPSPELADAGGLRDLLPPELADADDLREIAPADARELNKVLLRRLRTLEEGTKEYSYVRATLVETNLSLVRFAVRRFNSHREPQEDLLQVGAVGLIKAIDRFDPDLGAEFTTFAIPTVLGEIRRHFRDTTWAVHVPRRLQELRILLAKAQERLSQDLDRAPRSPNWPSTSRSPPRRSSRG